jgi:type I restriction enzyme, R subunit
LPRSTRLYRLRTEADNHNRTLYGNNQAVYALLRYGVPVKIEAGKVTETVHLINWNEPEKNDFAIAEEVTLRGNHERRPDIVLYVNGIAIGVLELKRAVSASATASARTSPTKARIQSMVLQHRPICLRGQ